MNNRTSIRTPNTSLAALALAAAAFATTPAFAANICWVSDANDPAVGFFPAGSGYSDSGFVTMLQNAGHNVIRYNQPNGQGTLLTPVEIAALNTNDVIIISRTVNSAAFQQGQGDQWNRDITAPLIDMSPFHVRAGSNRLGWFAGAEGPDSLPSVISAMLTGNPATDAAIDYVFGGVTMNGTNTAHVYDELLDRNTSQIAGAPVAGAIVYGTSIYMRNDGNTTPAFGNIIVGFPAGTAVRFGTNILGGYRMFFSAGSRESTVAPNSIPLYSGRETLSPTGEDIFLRSIQLAINNGTPPATDPNAPIVFTTQPANATVVQNSSVTFSARVTGAATRFLQWQRDTGDGVTFTNIPDAGTPFSGTSITLTNLSLTDNGARFRVEGTNAQGTVISSVAQLTVNADTTPPVPLSAASVDSTSIVICFNEVLDKDLINNSAEEEFNYLVNDLAPPQTATLRPDGRSVVLTLADPITASFTVKISFVEDQFNNAMVTDVILTGINHGLSVAAVGSLSPVGTVVSCTSNTVDITGGGVDLQSTADQFQFAYRTVTGDFDARVRVTSLVGIDRLESTAKAILTARSSTDSGSAAVNVFITPSYPADDTISSSVRLTAGAATNVLSAATVPNGLPNSWLRIQRVGDVFTTFRSSNGTAWTTLGSTNVALGASAVVGMGVNSHLNGRLAAASFSDFQIATPVAQPTLTNPNLTGTSFSASFQSQAGVSYRIQYSDTLNSPSWTTLTTIVGDGTAQPFTDATATGSMRFYRVVTP